MVRVAALEHEFELAAEAEGGIGRAHGLRPAQQADAQGVRRRLLQRHDGQGGVGGPLREEPVGKELVVDPRGCSVGFPFQQEAGGAAGEEMEGGQFQQQGRGQHDGEEAHDSPDQTEPERRPWRQFKMVGKRFHAMQVLRL